MSQVGVESYNCPYCRRPFSFFSTGQLQKVTCPSCGSQVTINPSQPSTPLPHGASVPYNVQGLQPSTVYQQPYPPYYPQSMYTTQTHPPKKSRAVIVVAVMIVALILIMAALLYIFIYAQEEGRKGNGTGEENVPTVTYDDFLNDINIDTISMTVTFDSYDEGDIIDVVHTVEYMRLANVPSGVDDMDPGIWTIIYFDPPTGSAIPMFDRFAYPGDLRSEYTIGEEGTVRVHIKEMSYLGITMECPEEYMKAITGENYLQPPIASLEFTETSPGNYTGKFVSPSGDIFLSGIEIEIKDFSSGYSGYDDGDLTDDNPEVVEVWYGNLELQFINAHDDVMLDGEDIFILINAESGDEISIYNTYSWDLIAFYTIA